MPLFRRQDALLVAGPTAAVVVIFAPPISQMLDHAREVEREKRLAFVPPSSCSSQPHVVS
jgi:hypothetical protein